MALEPLSPGVLHIIPIGADINTVSIGIRHYPVKAMAFIHTPEMKDLAQEFCDKFDVLCIPLSLHVLKGNTMAGMFSVFNEIIKDLDSNEVVVNVGAANKHIACAAISASFVNGLPAFHVLEGKLVPLPIMRFSYNDHLTETKRMILNSLQDHDGHAADMNDLVEWTGLSKSLLSYHLRGNEDNRGLEDLGFIRLSRSKRGRLAADLTSMGEVVLVGRD